MCRCGLMICYRLESCYCKAFMFHDKPMMANTNRAEATHTGLSQQKNLNHDWNTRYKIIQFILIQCNIIFCLKLEARRRMGSLDWNTDSDISKSQEVPIILCFFANLHGADNGTNELKI